MTEEVKKPKTYKHVEITMNHNSDTVRIEGPSIRHEIHKPKSMTELQILINTIITSIHSDSEDEMIYVTLTEENEETRKTIEEW